MACSAYLCLLAADIYYRVSIPEVAPTAAMLVGASAISISLFPILFVVVTSALHINFRDKFLHYHFRLYILFFYHSLFVLLFPRVVMPPVGGLILNSIKIQLFYRSQCRCYPSEAPSRDGRGGRRCSLRSARCQIRRT